MARKRNDYGPDGEALIKAHMARGGTVLSITQALRAGPVPTATTATVHRRMKELRHEVHEARLARRREATTDSIDSSGEELPTSPDQVPDGATTADYDRWIARAERMADDADAEGDVKAAAVAGRLVGFFMAERRKAAPEPIVDPDDHPDMVAMGAEATSRLERLCEMVVEEWRRDGKAQ